MSRQLIIKVSPNETLRFPSLCTNCAGVATERMEISRQDGRIRRQIDVPICAQCARQLHKTSAAEERLQKQRWLFTIISALLFLLALLLLLSRLSFGLRLLIALLVAIAVGSIVWQFFRIAINNAALPAKKVVLASAQLRDFSWRTATFNFSNEKFIEHFTALNDQLLLDK